MEFNSHSRSNVSRTEPKRVKPDATAGLRGDSYSRGRRGEPASKKKWLVAGAALFVLLVCVAYFFLRGGMGGTIGSGYQAVFLSSGQVYFGKLQVVNDSYLKITNVYYIQNKADSVDTTDSNNIELIKLTKAVHGPKDELVINRDHVLFFENLEDQGQAAKLISGDNKK